MPKLFVFFTYFQKAKLACAFSLFIFFGLNQTIEAQTGVNFIDSLTGKVIKARQGDYLIIRYRGYLGQTETYKHTLQGSSDSSLLIGLVHPYSPLSVAFSGANNPWKEIKFNDIESFKRRSGGAQFLKSMLGIGAGLGAILMLKNLNEEKKFSNGKNLAISLGVGIGINIGMNLLFSDKPKYKMKEGWRVESVK